MRKFLGFFNFYRVVKVVFFQPCKTKQTFYLIKNYLVAIDVSIGLSSLNHLNCMSGGPCAKQDMMNCSPSGMESRFLLTSIFYYNKRKLLSTFQHQFKINK